MAFLAPELTKDFVSWLATLSRAYGNHYLFAIFCYNHVLKGFVLMYAFTSLDFVLRMHHVRGPQMQVLKSVALLPWVLKPLLGIVSDTFPILGYRKNPYIAGATLVGAASFAVVGLHGPQLPLGPVVAAFFGMSVQISACDLLTDAATAERIRAVPLHGPALMAFVTGGTTLGDILATATVGTVLQRLGPCGPALLCAPLSALALVPACLNCLGERRGAGQQAPGEIRVLAGAVGLGSLALVAALMAPLVLLSKLLCVGCVSLTVVGSFTILLNPTVGLMNAFFFLQSMSAISVEGGSFYFFTDDPTSFPLGPHFSVWFYTTGLGLAGNVCGLLGIWAYARFMTHWRYRSIFLLSNTLWCAVSAANTLVFTRQNLLLGIPDQAFVLGGTVLQNVFERWTYVPGGVLLSQVCPPGLEATMFALLAGCHNLGRSVASYLGSLLLTHLQVSPNGRPHEEGQFLRLWQAAACQALAPLLTLWLLPRMIPDAVQTERLEGEAVAGSPWSRLRGRKQRDGGTGGYGALEGADGHGDTGSSDGGPVAATA